MSGASAVEQFVVKQFLARERALLRGQRLVLECLEFRRDVALGVFERLAAPVIVGDFLGLRPRDFDVKAVHAVVFDLEIGDTAARALARLEIEQELAAVAVERAQFVELRIEAVGDHAAFAHDAPPARRGSRWRNSVPTDSSGCTPTASSRRRGLSSAASCALSTGSRASVSRNPERSRGRALFKRDARGDALDVDARL